MSNFAALSNGLSPPRPGTAVWKNECAFSFATATSSLDGLFINLTTFQAFARQYVPLDNSRTGNVLYLHHVQTKTPVVETQDAASPKASNTDKDGRPTKLAIGVAGGFDVAGKKYTVTNTYTVVSFPSLSDADGLVYSDEEMGGEANNALPLALRNTVAGLLRHDDNAEKKAVEAWSAENEMIFESKFARNLVQLDNGVKISPDPSTWVCAESGIKENLWLNLSTGHIGSGRRNWDGTGGTGAALTHFQQTGNKYPLVVKLGTISERGADVYSYSPEEDCMVTDPLLAQHLAHWGIDVGKMEKTAKTVAELEVDMNANYDWSKITEGVDQLESVHGAGLIGLQNLGNSCYLNSVVQVLMSLNIFRQRFGWKQTPEELCAGLFSAGNLQTNEPQSDPLVQLTKLASGISDPDWQCNKDPDDDEWSLRPTMLKLALAGDNSDFCGGEQQDAQEFLMHVLGAIERAHATRGGGNAGEDPTKAFRFHMQSRVEDMQSQKVKYLKTANSVLSLSVPAHLSSKVGGTGEDKDRLQVSFEDCLRTSVGYDNEAAATIEDFLSPVTGKRGVAVTSTSMVTMPQFLWVSVGRYVLDGWVPKKLEIDIPVPETLDLSKLRARGGGGMQQGEEALPEETQGGAAAAAAAPVAVVEPDDALVSQLVGMGFPLNGCKRAAVATNNGSVEAAMEWVLTNMSDPDFDTPIPEGGVTVGAPATAADTAPPGVDMLTSMGFSNPAALLALKTNGNDVERAANWLFNHTDDIETLLVADAAAGSDTAAKGGAAAADSPGGGVVDHPSGKYRMRAIVSHMGKSVHSGHYVCHIRQDDGRWILFNDRKVAVSKKPPFELGYLYLFEAV